MSHRQFAAIWSTLQGRFDIDNIVQELIGRYSLDILHQKSDRSLYRATSFAHIVALRTIFDLQRTYLQSSDPSLETKSSVLDSRILFSALSHLLEIKVSAFSAHDNLPDHEGYCSYIAQTQLSGLRALLLHKIRLSQRDYEAFHSRYFQVWDLETLRGLDQFVVLFSRHILTELCSASQESHRQYSRPACGLALFQDFDRGLYPVEDPDNGLLHAVRNSSSVNPTSADWILSALVLYDTIWSTVAATIQLCADAPEPKEQDGWVFDAARITLETRFKLLDSIFRHPTVRSVPHSLEWTHEHTRSLICSGISYACFGSKCACFGVSMTDIQELWVHHVRQEARSSVEDHLSKLHHLDIGPILTELHSVLEARNNIIPQINIDLKQISQKITDDINDWYPEHPRGTSGSKHTPQDDVFIMNCPELHPVSAAVLLGSLEDHSFEGPQPASLSSADIRFLKDFPAKITCHQCSWNSKTVSARKVEPLNKISEHIQERLRSRRKAAKSRVDRMTNVTTLSLQSASTVVPLRVRAISPSPLRTNDSSMPPMQNAIPRPKIELNQSNMALPGNRLSTSPRSPPRPVHGGRMVSASPSLRKPASMASTYIGGSASSPVIRTSTMSVSSSQSQESRSRFTPQLFPSQAECTTLPEVVEPPDPRMLHSPKSIRSSDSASTRSYQSPKYQERKPWSIFKAKGMKISSSPPSATFFTSGRSLMIWNDAGAVCYDLENQPSISVRIVTVGEVLLAAGGTRKCAVISKSESTILLRCYQDSNKSPLLEMELEEIPFKMAVSSNDHYLALKFGAYVRILDTLNGNMFHHQLPTKSGRSGQVDHLVAFSTDCLSFIACTRYEPGKVISYYCECQTPENYTSIESDAPTGFVSDCGLSTILLTNKSAFLSTFTERGYPTYLTFSSGRPTARTLRDKDLKIGSRIHKAALCATGQNLVLLNDRNSLFWIASPFGKEQLPVKIGTVKRATSVKREVEIAMPGVDVVNVFWIEKGQGVLVTMGLAGGKSRPVDVAVDVERILADEEGR